MCVITRTPRFPKQQEHTSNKISLQNNGFSYTSGPHRMYQHPPLQIQSCCAQRRTSGMMLNGEERNTIALTHRMLLYVKNLLTSNESVTRAAFVPHSCLEAVFTCLIHRPTTLSRSSSIPRIETTEIALLKGGETIS
jgi:hypothetical protein